MPLNRSLIGRSYRASAPYEVGREHIRAFADAIGDPNPVYRDPAAAQALGHPDVIAPPTYLTVLTNRFVGEGPVVDPELGLDFAMVVHGEQRFVHHRPVRAGDRLSATVTVTDIREAGRNELVTMEQEIATVDGEAVCSAYSVIVSRGTAGGAQ